MRERRFSVMAEKRLSGLRLNGFAARIHERANAKSDKSGADESGKCFFVLRFGAHDNGASQRAQRLENAIGARQETEQGDCGSSVHGVFASQFVVSQNAADDDEKTEDAGNKRRWRSQAVGCVSSEIEANADENQDNSKTESCSMHKITFFAEELKRRQQFNATEVTLCCKSSTRLRRSSRSCST